MPRPDDLGPEITYAFVDDADAAVAPNGAGLSIFGGFAIDATTGVITVDTAPVYAGDATDTRTLTIRATDTSPGASGEQFVERDIVIEVVLTIDSDNAIDSDNDGLIDINTLEELNNIRNNLEGTSYKTSDVDPGNTTGCPATGCFGYELMGNLDFADAASYATGSINSDWRPDNADPDMATNAGWEPIGSCNEDTGDEDIIRCGDADDTPFAAMFEGNGYTISNLYTRGAGAVGLFGITAESAEIRNVGVVGNNSYGESGIFDNVGGLVGWNSGEIIASYATGNADGGSGDIDLVGGLVGFSSGEIIASYATGNADGGSGTFDRVGGLVGFSSGEIIASYATGNADGHFVGGLVGFHYGSTITASYATGDVNGNNVSGSIGALVGLNSGSAITASYGFGAVTGVGTRNTHGAPPADESIHSPAVLTATNSSTTPANRWNTTVWDFGNDRLYPVVKWVTGYDATAGTFSCDQTMLPDGQTCGDPLPDQYDSDDDGTQDMVPAAPSTPTVSSTVFTITITWTALADPAITDYRLYRNATAGNNALGNRPIATVAASEPLTYTDSAPLDGENYYAVSAISEVGEGARSPSASATRLPIDSDNDGLIDINTLEELNNIRYNLEGTSYKVSADGSGNSEGCPATGCFGYELMGNLDFEEAASYAAGGINSDWRPDNADPDMATNAGWEPIGSCNEDTDDTDVARCGDADDTPFAAMFEGNGYTISNLYTRGTGGVGLFGITAESAEIRNVGLIDNNSYSEGTRDRVGGLVGRNNGEIIASYATGNADGGSGNDSVGGLVGLSSGEIIASYATGSAYGGAERDTVGGLVGLSSGEIIASYATGSANGGGGDNVGGLAGRNDGEIIASYATGSANGVGGNLNYVGGLAGYNDGEIIASYATGDSMNGDRVGGLVGWNGVDGNIIASYATGDADVSGSHNVHVGGLVGLNYGVTITASYGFGAVTGVGSNTHGAPPGGVTSPVDLTATNAGAQWNVADDDTLNAWDFGSGSQTPAVRFADYDGAGTDYDCDMFPDTLPDGTPITCGTTLIPGQGR